MLFGDLSDFTAWSEDVDPERVGAVTDRVLAALAGAVKTFGGHVDKLTGDGIMAVFGAPGRARGRRRAGRPGRAVDAARGAPGARRRARRRRAARPAGRAEHRRRWSPASRPRIEYTVIGDTVNTAARLADAAAVGAVYAGAAHLRRHPARRLLAAAAAAAAQGQARAGRGVRAARPARRAGHPVRPRRRGAVRRPGDRAGPGRRPARRGRSTGASRGSW